MSKNKVMVLKDLIREGTHNFLMFQEGPVPVRLSAAVLPGEKEKTGQSHLDILLPQGS